MNKEYGQNPAQVEAASKAETQRTIKKTPLMVAIEQRCALPGESIGDFVRRKYLDHNTLVDIVQEIHTTTQLSVDPTTLRSWLRLYHPEFTIKTLKELWRDTHPYQFKAKWKNPQTIAQITAGLQTPETREKRGHKTREYFRNHPDVLADLAKAASEGRKKKKAERQLELLGKNPRRTLLRMLRKPTTYKLPRPERLRYSPSSLHERADTPTLGSMYSFSRIHPSSLTRRGSASEYKQIATNLGIAESTLRLWLKEYGITSKP